MFQSSYGHRRLHRELGGMSLGLEAGGRLKVRGIMESSHRLLT